MNQCQFVKVKYKYVFHKTKSCNNLCYDRSFKTLSIATHSPTFCYKTVYSSYYNERNFFYIRIGLELIGGRYYKLV